MKIYECELCEAVVGAEDKAIECEICKEWFHAGCVDLTDNEYEVLSTHKIGTIHWYCATCNVKSVELLRLVFGLQDRLQKSEREIESLKRETHAKFSKLDSEYEAVREDLKTLNQKIDDGLKQCKVDSDKLVKSIQHQTRNEIKEEIEEVKATSLADIMKEEMEKSLGNMASEIDSVKCNLNETIAKADEQRDKESRRNNVVLYKVPESNADRAEDRIKEDISFCLKLFNNGLQVGMSDAPVCSVLKTANW